MSTAFYYCDYADKRTLDPATVFATMARQILEPLPRIPEALLHSIEHANHDGDKLTDHRKTLDILRDAIHYVEEARIILDGMDELSERSQKIVCEGLREVWQGTDAVVKFFITGREDPSSMILVNDKILRVQILPSSISTDISQYVRDATSFLLSKGELVLQDSSLQEVIVEKLVEGAHGM
jgi:hypothetical protein